MKEKAVLFPSPGHILHITIESSRDYQLRLEAEAAALAGMDSPQAKALAQELILPKPAAPASDSSAA